MKFDIKVYFNFGYTTEDLLQFDYNLISKLDRIKLRKSLNESYYYSKDQTKENIGKVLSILTDIGMNQK